MTDDFDDDVLRSAIGSRSGGPVHTGAARQTVVARAERTRAVRTGAIVGTTSLVVVAGLFLLPSIGDTQPEPADQPAAPTIDSIAPPPTTIDPPSATSTPDTPEPTTTTATTPPDASSPAAPASTAPSIPSTAPAPASTTQPMAAPTTSPPTTSPPTTTAPSVAPTTTVASTATTAASDPTDPPFTQRYDSAGGSITVDWNGAALTLLSTDPAAGYVAEIEDRSAGRIRVRFRSDGNDSRIEVRVRDGHVEHTIS